MAVVCARARFSTARLQRTCATNRTPGIGHIPAYTWGYGAVETGAVVMKSFHGERDLEVRGGPFGHFGPCNIDVVWPDAPPQRVVLEKAASGIWSMAYEVIDERYGSMGPTSAGICYH